MPELMETDNKIVAAVTKLWVGADKPSHFWTWHKYPFPENFQGYWIPEDSDAFSPKYYNFLTYLRITNKKWGWMVLIVYQPHLALLGESRKIDWWNYAWSLKDHQFLDRCNVNIDPKQAVRILVGPKPFRIYGVGSDGLEVPLSVSAECSRNNTRAIRFPIL